MQKLDPREFEVWRSVTDFPNYEISSFGRVRVLDRRVDTANGQNRFYKGGLIAPCRNQHGHLKVMLVRVPGKKEPRYIHQLVAQEFIGARPDGHEVAHGDGNPQNNRLGNLRYATPAENQADKIGHGTHGCGEKHPSAKLTEDDVRNIRQRLAKHDRQKDIAADYGVARGTIASIAQGRSWSHQHVGGPRFIGREVVGA